MSDSRPSLWKQLLGALVGATVALAIYSVVTTATPFVTAMFVSGTSMAKGEPTAIAEQEDVTAVLEEAERTETEDPIELPAAVETAFVEDFSPIETVAQAAVSSAPSSAINAVRATATHPGAPVLPNSGIGMWLMLCAASGVTALFYVRRKSIRGFVGY